MLVDVEPLLYQNVAVIVSVFLSIAYAVVVVDSANFVILAYVWVVALAAVWNPYKLYPLFAE